MDLIKINYSNVGPFFGSGQSVHWNSSLPEMMKLKSYNYYLYIEEYGS